jgi:hypothetical protein
LDDFFSIYKDLLPCLDGYIMENGLPVPQRLKQVGGGRRGKEEGREGEEKGEGEGEGEGKGEGEREGERKGKGGSTT